MLGSSWKPFKTDMPTAGSTETDAVKIDKFKAEQTNVETNAENSVYNSDVPLLTLEETQVSENTMNVNQQLVVQFSNINGLQIGSTYNINNECNTNAKISNGNKVKRCKHKYPKTMTIEEMMNSQDELNGKFLTEIATHLGSDYKMFMRKLGYSEGQISSTYLDHSPYGVREVIYQLLLDWERNTDGERTVGYLTTLLWNCGHRECVHRLKTLWKLKTKNKS